jgi:hypothetical protein
VLSTLNLIPFPIKTYKKDPDRPPPAACGGSGMASGISLKMRRKTSLITPTVEEHSFPDGRNMIEEAP